MTGDEKSAQEPAPQPSQLEPARPRPPAGLKRLLFQAGALLMVLIAIELCSFVALQVMHARGLRVDVSDFVAGEAEVSEINNPAAKPLRGIGPDFDEVLHPYVGFVVTASAPERQDLKDLGWVQPTLFKRSPERVIVALTGGSVARQIYELSGDLFKAELAKIPRFHGKEIVLVGLCLGGYKQPQQLMILNYLLTLGGEFDIVVNVDGFNEVAIHEPENGRNGVFPIFPRWWQGRVNDVANPEMSAYAGEIAFYRKQLQELQESKWVKFLRRFQTGRLWRTYRVKSLHREIDRVIAEMSGDGARGATRYIATGPRWEFTDDELYDHLTDIWQRSSQQMRYLARGNGIEYYHFLQPNQYVEGSKPMGDEERSHAYDPQMRYRPGAEKGYPLLIAKGQELLKGGEAYTDLTQMFVNELAPMYRDTCCHFLQPGVDALARKIASEVAAGPK
jgi:hypothetical protein